MAHSDNSYPKYIRDVKYSEASSLNTLNICLSRRNDDASLWVLFIHGGAWCDPRITASSFDQTQEALLEKDSAGHIAGYASINYRLSPHRDYPKPKHDPAYNARHPDHIDDVLNAIKYLQIEYSIGSQYILAGHSCGATLAFQVAMAMDYMSSAPVHKPCAIVAMEGLYDLPALIRYHADMPIYREYIAGAFGEDEALWKKASPTSGDYDKTWPAGRLIVLAHSHDDELVEWEQVELMRQELLRQDWLPAGSDKTPKTEVLMMELKGKHDEIWEKGDEAARAIWSAIDYFAKD